MSAPSPVPVSAGALEAAAAGAEGRGAPFLERLAALYARMDEQYRAVAQRYGFHCQGCRDSCCRTTFYHHTLVEYLYLRAGIQTLEKGAAAGVLAAARRVEETPGASLFCPLNEGGRCRLYSYRPMICRLHGIAHELRRPDGSVHYGAGCAAFDAAVGTQPYIPFDRSGFYWELSALERKARGAMDVSGRIHMTISQMVIEHLSTPPAPGGSPP